MTPEAAAQARSAVLAERGNSHTFDICVWGSADLSGAFEAAGVTWLMQAARPEDSVDHMLGIITVGRPGSAGNVRRV